MITVRGEAILENAYDIIVTGEINGEDTRTFPFRSVTVNESGKRKENPDRR